MFDLCRGPHARALEALNGERSKGRGTCIGLPSVLSENERLSEFGALRQTQLTVRASAAAREGTLAFMVRVERRRKAHPVAALNPRVPGLGETLGELANTTQLYAAALQRR